MNKIIILLSFFMFFSCSSEFTNLLKSKDKTAKYKAATAYYECEKYSKAVTLLEQIEPLYRGTPQSERIQFFLANAYFKNKDYQLSSNKFSVFKLAFPKSSKLEEASFLRALGFYYDSPVYELDNTNTLAAINALKNHLRQYPNSEKSKKAKKLLSELNLKIEKKYFELAKQYYHRDDFKAAIIAFENVISDFPNSSLMESILFYKLKSSYKLGINSIEKLKKERLLSSISDYKKYKNKFPEGKLLDESNKMLKKLNIELKKIQK